MSKSESEKPRLTGTNHLARYFDLSPAQFERLCLWLVVREGYEKAEHLGASGDDRGCDILAWRDGRKVFFQCKRVGRFGPAGAIPEIAKIRARPLEEQPDEVVFVVPHDLRENARRKIRETWGDPATCNFWAGTELDEKVKKHGDLLREFFQDGRFEPPPAPIVHLRFPSLGSHFAGREAALEALRTSLHRPGGGRTAIAGKAIHGLGGVGKTRLAVEYGWRFQEEYTAVLFVDAGSAANLRTGLAGLAGAALGLTEGAEPDDAVREAAVLRWLRAHPPWLLILDNVDDEAAATAVDELLGRLTGGHVLLTGRLAHWGAGIDTQELEVLAEPDAAAFLLERTVGKRREAKDDADRAAELARELGGLPLALEQAAAYLCLHRLTLAAYLAAWRTERERVLAWYDERVMKYPASVAVTWAKSVAKLTPEAKRLLDLLAWLGPEPIPEFLLNVPVPGEEKEEVEKNGVGRREALAELAGYSLVSRSKEEESFTVHRLVQEVTRREQGRREPERAEPRRGRVEEALGWVDSAFVGDPNDVRTWGWLGPLAPHAKAVAGFADGVRVAAPTAALMSRVALHYNKKALHAEAEPLIRRALSIDESSCGPEHPTVAIRLNNLASLLQATNRLGEAEPLMRRALSIDESSLGPEHPKVVISLNNLAQLLQDTNRLGEAEPLMRRALSIDESSFGPEHLEVAISLNNLAQLLQATNRLEEAEPLMRRALSIDESRLGAEHPNVAISLNNLAQLLQATNRQGEAEPLMRRALSIDESSFGPEHPNVARDLNNLAVALQATNRLREAEPLMCRVVEIIERSLGAEHPKMAISLNNLAQLLQATNRLEEAEPLMRRAVAIFERSLGIEHPNVAAALNNLAALLKTTNRLEEAEPLMRRALSIDESSFGPEHPAVAIALNNLALLLKATNRLGEAEPLMRRAVVIFATFRRGTGHEHPSWQVVLGNYKDLLRALGKPEQEIRERLMEVLGPPT